MYRIAIVCLTASVGFSRFVSAQSCPAVVGTYTTPPAIHQMNEVSRSLTLNDDQMIRLNELLGNLQGSYREYYTAAGKLPDAERASRLDELNRKYTDEWMRGAKTVLNESQMTRYRQLHWQYSGFNSFSDPDMQKRLNLTDEQRKTLRDNRTWSDQQIREINRVGASDPERADKLHRDYQKAYQAKIDKFLTPEQLRTWRNVTGEHFEFPRTPTPSR
jgi:hypothetical protein